MITLEEFMNSEYNDILNATVFLQVDGERIEVTEEISTPEFFKKYEKYEIEEIRPTIKAPKQEDICEDDCVAEIDVHLELAFLVVLKKYVYTTEELEHEQDR